MKYVFVIAVVLVCSALIVWNVIELIKTIKARVKANKEKKETNLNGLDTKESERKEK